jgi:CO/xanthine dehydrogenase Mo-binding subunit
VAAVLTWKDVPRVVWSTAGQSDPIPGPLDTFSLDNKVRFVGDRVAFVAAETSEIAERALQLIKVDYEVLPAVLDPADAMGAESPRIHDEPEYVDFADSDAPRTWRPDPNRHWRCAQGVSDADQILSPITRCQVQVSIEPHGRHLLG